MAWPAGLRDRVDDWLADDPDPVARDELAGLIERVDDLDPVSRDEIEDQAERAELDAGETRATERAPTGEDVLAEIVDRFSGDLAFGTAGLRGALGAGPNRMNLAVVIRAAAGIVSWLRTIDGGGGGDGGGGDRSGTGGGDGRNDGDSGGEPTLARDDISDRGGESDSDGFGPHIGAAGHVSVARRGVVIGFDARHRSADFAEATASVFAAAGIQASVLPEPLPTPVLAFAVRHLGAAAGVMVTASHNPAVDNGYKVYDGTGRQIVAPTDRVIAEAMAAVDRISMVPRTGPDDPDIVRLGDDVASAYVDASCRIAPGVDIDGPCTDVVAEQPHRYTELRSSSRRDLRIAYTAMHGVGAATFRRVLTAAGFAPPVEVAEQVEPDPSFPTVVFPNPEEPGALDLGLGVARGCGADLLIAHDPDADRLGVAVPDRTLNGSPGAEAPWRVLTGDEIGVILAQHLLRTNAIGPRDVLATTIVSSSLLAKMAARAKRPYVETLTGFKWLSRAASGRSDDSRLGFAYEEALGFCVGDLVGDKDGITAALVFADAVASLAVEGRTVLDLLDELARDHGVHHTSQRSIRAAGADGQDRIATTMARLRASPPVELAAKPVIEVVDLVIGDEARKLPPSNVVVLHLDGARIVVRPSGTEPKLKTYVEVVTPVAPGETVADVRVRTGRSAADLHDAMEAALAAG